MHPHPRGLGAYVPLPEYVENTKKIYLHIKACDDICSIECKSELLQRIKFLKETQSEQLLVGSPLYARRCTLEVPESGGDTWDYDRHRWSKKISGFVLMNDILDYLYAYMQHLEMSQAWASCRRLLAVHSS